MNRKEILRVYCMRLADGRLAFPLCYRHHAKDIMTEHPGLVTPEKTGAFNEKNLNKNDYDN